MAKPVKTAHILIVKNRERAPNRHRSGLHDEDLINQAFKPVKTMVDHENGCALGFEFPEDAGKRHCGFRIQIGARLIENERFGAERENRGESDLLLLPFRELVNVLREKMFNPHALGSTVYAGTDFFKRYAAAFEREGDLIAHIEREELLFGILEKRTDMFREHRYGRILSGIAVDQYFARQGAAVDLRTQAVHQPHDRRLAAARGAGNKLKLARINREIKTSNRIRRVWFGTAVAVGNFLQFNRVHGLNQGMTAPGVIKSSRRKISARSARTTQTPIAIKMFRSSWESGGAFGSTVRCAVPMPFNSAAIPSVSEDLSARKRIGVNSRRADRIGCVVIITGPIGQPRIRSVSQT